MKPVKLPPPTAEPRVRQSNLALFRVVAMLLIVAHHYVVNSGLLTEMMKEPSSLHSLSYLWFGMWGKTGINCFMMITGYFMCKSDITMKKLVKLLTQIYFYKMVIFLIFLFTGYEQLTASRLLRLLSPVWGFNTDFVSCFILFFLTIPFWNILIRHINQRQHLYLMALLVGGFSLLPTYPDFVVTNNYVVWFGVIYVVASYIRLYPVRWFEKRALWGWLTVALILLTVMSTWVISSRYAVRAGEVGEWQMYKYLAYFVYESTMFMPLCIGVSSFLFFKNLQMPYIKAINIVGASTFGVLLIHANSNAMRQWLWQDVVDCVGHYASNVFIYPLCAVIIIFTLCILIDRLRILFIEKQLLNFLCPTKV